MLIGEIQEKIRGKLVNKIEENRKKNRDKVVRFGERMKAKGYVWLCRWVPKKFKSKVDDFIKELRG